MPAQASPAHRRLADRYGRAPLLLPVNDKLAMLLSQIFSSEEAGLARVFPMRPATAASLARRAGIPVETAEQLLDDMAQRGVIGTYSSRRL